MDKKGIVIVGSTNIDMIIRTNHIPKVGETVGNGIFSTAYGGKGANQAIAAARAGGSVIFVSNLGDDVYGKQLIPYFRQNGINADYVYRDKENSTGVAFILVGGNGENSIAVAPGANGNLNGEKLPEIYHVIEQAEVMLLQFEIPYTTVISLIEYANKVGTKVVLNPAPAMPIEKDIIEKIDVLILNETEAEIITGIQFDKFSPLQIAHTIKEKGVNTVILTLGSKGCVFVADEQEGEVTAYEVNAIDTTAAGDTFSGAFVVNWMETKDLKSAIEFATAAAAIAVTSLGAQPSIPNKEKIIEFIKESNIQEA